MRQGIATSLVVFAVVSFFLMAGSTSMPSEPSLVISCRALPGAVQSDDEAHLEGLCTTLRATPAIQALPADRRLALVVELLRPDRITAYLEWQTPEGLQRGPSVDFGFLDTSLSPAQYGFVVNGLIRATNLL